MTGFDLEVSLVGTAEGGGRAEGILATVITCFRSQNAAQFCQHSDQIYAPSGDSPMYQKYLGDNPKAADANVSL